MKLIKLLAVFSILLSVKLAAVTISGNIYCDLNDNGSIETGEVCPSDGAWVKLYNVSKDKWISQEPLYPSGAYLFEISATGDFRVFIDNNGDSTKDSTPTPPSGMLFSDPLSGSLTINIPTSDDNSIGNDFVLIPDPACDCSGGDNNMTIAPIVIDGNMGDWTTVIPDPDNGVCDSSTITDYDINKTNTGKIQSTGRNLVRFVWTGQDDENGYVYGYTERLGSNTNTETFLFYKDGDADGLMESGDIALVASWQGNTGTVKMEICDYVVDATDGDASSDFMVWQPSDVGTSLLYPGGTTVPQEWVGKADGYTLHGGLTNCRTSPGLIGSGSSDGLHMEWQVPWKTVGMIPFQPITYHVSTMNASVNQTNPPGQVDDNMGSCPLAAPVVKLNINKTADTTTPRVGDDVTYTITVTNSGDATSSVTVDDLLPVGMTYVSYSGTDWMCTNSGQDVNCSYAGVLINGASTSLEVVASVDAGTLGDILTNTACVASDENLTLVCDDENITVASSILQISKGVSDETPYVNAIVTYEINVTNTGPNIAHNVVLNDSLPVDIHYIDYTGANWTCIETLPDVIDCNYISPLGVGETTTVTFGVNVNGTAGVDYNNTACTNSDDSTTDVCDSVILTPKATPTDVVLSMAKGVDENTPLIGETITYTMAVTNVGDTQATDVNVTDILPPELNFVSASGGGSYDGGTRTISWSLPTLDASASMIFTITAIVNATAVVDTPVNNEVCAVADQNLTPQCADINFTPRDPIVTMLIDKVVDNELPKVDDEVTYTIVVTNSGTDTANNVEVNDTLPFGVTYSSDSPSVGTYNPPVWDGFDLIGGASAELNITVTIDPDTEGSQISNEACVNADENATAVCDDANLTVARVILTIQKISDQNEPPEDANITYTIVVNNIGDVNATNVTVSDTLPADVTYVSVGGNGWTCIDSGTIDCSYLFELEPGIPSSFDINVTVDPGTAGTTLTNTACTQADENTTLVCVDQNITVNDDLDLVVTKDVNNSTPLEGETILYTITVTNNGPINATGVEITENIAELTDGLTNIIANPPLADEDTWIVGDLDVGQTATLLVTATVAGSGEYKNFASLSGLDQTDIDSDNNSAEASITVSCLCENISSDSSPAMNNISAVLMMFMTLMLGIFFVRREDKLNRNER